MSSALSLIDELEGALQRGSSERRTEVLRRVTDLFVDAAPRYTEEQTQLFDDVMGHLMTQIETRALSEMSVRLAPIDNAPIGVIHRLAHDDAIEISGPVLTNSERLSDDVLVEIARSKGQAHLVAIAGRAKVNELVTDILVERGDAKVANTVAVNAGARFSQAGFSKLVSRAEHDEELTMAVGSRGDIPADLFRQLVVQATEAVQKKLVVAADPDMQGTIKQILAELSGEIGNEAARDYATAQHLVQRMHQDGLLTPVALQEFAKARRVEETVAALSLLSSVGISVIDRLIRGGSDDGAIILCRAAELDWTTTKFVIVGLSGHEAVPSLQMQEAHEKFLKLSSTSAKRVIRFWHVRQKTATTATTAPPPQAVSKAVPGAARL